MISMSPSLASREPGTARYAGGREILFYFFYFFFFFLKRLSVIISIHQTLKDYAQ